MRPAQARHPRPDRRRVRHIRWHRPRLRHHCWPVPGGQGAGLLKVLHRCRRLGHHRETPPARRRPHTHRADGQPGLRRRPGTRRTRSRPPEILADLPTRPLQPHTPHHDRSRGPHPSPSSSSNRRRLSAPLPPKPAVPTSPALRRTTADANTPHLTCQKAREGGGGQPPSVWPNLASFSGAPSFTGLSVPAPVVVRPLAEP